MKSKYRKLKFSILLQTVFVTALTVLVGGFVLKYVVDGFYNDRFANQFVKLLMYFHIQEQTAIDLYWKLIGHNKMFFLLIGFLLLFALFYYASLSKLTKYLVKIEEGIENITSDSTEPVRLVTELEPIEKSLNEIKSTLKRKELQELQAENKKNDLIVFLAHDLKTPLTSVVAYLSLIEAHPEMPEEERARYLHISLEKSIRLGELINEFFEITKLNLQDIVVERTEINLTMMLEQIADELYAVLQERNLRCEVKAEDDLVIQADPDKLVRVFDNILRNAIAYCYPNSRILITAQEIEEGIQIVFSNSGETLAKEQLDMIFEKFYRADSSRSTATGGAGLGLAIAKKIVELHGGKIWAESSDNTTRFIVVLPKEVEAEDEVRTHSRHTFRGDSRRRKSVQRKPRERTVE